MQAFVITAYKDYEALKTLTLALSQRGLCVIHADAQGAITARQVDELNALPNVRAIRKYKVNWGSVCHLYALLDLCRMALEDERVDYLHLMSAQDVPLLCADEMERRFAGETRLFMQRLSTAENPELAHRYEHYHFMHWLNYRDPSERTQNWVGRIDRWQDRLHIRRRLALPYKGMVWLSLPRDAAQYAVSGRAGKKLLRRLRTTYIPEEFYFQNVFSGTAFEPRIVNRELHFSIWNEPERGLPAVLNMGDLEKMSASDCCFARKVDVDSELGRACRRQRESPMGCKAIRRERARKVALEGQGAPDTAQRGILLGVNEGGTTQSAASFGARRSAFFLLLPSQGRHAYEFSGGYDSGNLRPGGRRAADVFQRQALPQGEERAADEAARRGAGRRRRVDGVYRLMEHREKGNDYGKQSRSDGQGV